MTEQQQHTVDTETLVNIYLDGMMTGGASILRTIAGDVPEGMRDMLVHSMVASLKAGAYDQVVQQVMERLNGTDSGPVELLVPAVHPTE